MRSGPCEDKIVGRHRLLPDAAHHRLANGRVALTVNDMTVGLQASETRGRVASTHAGRRRLHGLE
jgi:hypothetical protein